MRLGALGFGDRVLGSGVYAKGFRGMFSGLGF